MIHHVTFAGVSGFARTRTRYGFPKYRYRFFAAGDPAILVALKVTRAAVHGDDFGEGWEGYKKCEGEDKRFHAAIVLGCMVKRGQSIAFTALRHQISDSNCEQLC